MLDGQSDTNVRYRDESAYPKRTGRLPRSNFKEQTMNRKIRKTQRSYARSPIDTLSARLLVGAALTLACGVATAQSIDVVPTSARQGADAPAPWVPGVIAAFDPYYGPIGLDHFAADNAADQVGAVTAQLSNGDRVVAGLVPDGNGSTCNNGTATCSIGLVRYSQANQRIVWTNPGDNGRFFDNYVVFPGGSATALRYQYIRDVKVMNGVIYVMVDTNDSSTGLGRQDVRIIAFNEDGSFLGIGLQGVFGYANGGDLSEDFFGAQMVIINSDRMMVVATAYDSSGPFVAVNRLNILPDHSLQQDPDWGVQYGNTTVNRLTRYYGPGGYCDQPRCNVLAGYAARQEGFATPTDFYVGGSIQINGDDWDTIALKISSEDGSIKPEFNGGWSRVAYDDTNSNFDDRGAGIYVFQDDVYLGAQVARECHPGIGLAKLNGATGDFIPDFGNGGKIRIGGEGSDDPQCSNGFADHVPFAISATGGRIGIVGLHHYIDQGELERVDPLLVVINAVNGQVLDFADHTVRRADGSRAGDAVLYSVFGGPNATSPFTVSGNGRDTAAGNTLSYLSGRFVPLSGDQIFADNFGTGDDH